MCELLTVIEVHKAVHFDRSFALSRFIGSCGLGSKVCPPYVMIHIFVSEYRDISMHESDDSDGFFFLRARHCRDRASIRLKAASIYDKNKFSADFMYIIMLFTPPSIVFLSCFFAYSF